VSLALRLALALVAAGVATFGLWRVVRAGERPPSQRPAPAAESSSRRDQTLAAIGGTAKRLLLVTPQRLPAERAAPAIEIEDSGLVRVLRPPPRPLAPGDSSWDRAAIVLPSPRLSTLSPSARAALLDVLARWRGRSSWQAADFQLAGIEEEGDELAMLIRWQR
jgi:hypothetical protein